MSEPQTEPIVLANWGRRFIAWGIDFLFINVMLAYVGLENFETKALPAYLFPELWSPISILVLFLYWTLSGWYFGRSIGQLLLNIRLTDLNGHGVSLAASAIQSIGKSVAFPVLPIDCLMAWTYPPCKKARQRFFNKLSNTIVIYVGKPSHILKQDGYAKEA
jgi:uncharacterized RDD family membrane protein YckC